MHTQNETYSTNCSEILYGQFEIVKGRVILIERFFNYLILVQLSLKMLVFNNLID